MALKKRIALLSLLITLFLFLSILIIGMMLNNKREEKLDSQFDAMYHDMNSMQTLFLMSEFYGNEMTCLAFESKLKDLDKYVWELGARIDRYRAATEEFQKDKYYLTQKKEFNENEVFYFLLMKRMHEQCNMTKSLILFFYENSEDCKKCDDQSFILTDIKLVDDEKGDREIAVFSFDTELNITTIELFKKYYKIDKYPCLVIDEKKYCGIQDKVTILNTICSEKPFLKICEIYDKGETKLNS